MRNRSYAVPGSHEIKEGIHWNQVCQRDTRKQPLGEEFLVNLGGDCGCRSIRKSDSNNRKGPLRLANGVMEHFSRVW